MITLVLLFITLLALVAVFTAMYILKQYRDILDVFSTSMGRLINTTQKLNNTTECFIDEMKEFKKSRMYIEWKKVQSQ